MGLVAVTIVGDIMCDCVEIIRKNKESIVAEAIKEEIIRSLVSKVKEREIRVVEGGTIEVVHKLKFDERVTRIAFSVVDKIIELLEEEK